MIDKPGQVDRTCSDPMCTLDLLAAWVQEEPALLQAADTPVARSSQVREWQRTVPCTDTARNNRTGWMARTCRVGMATAGDERSTGSPWIFVVEIHQELVVASIVGRTGPWIDIQQHPWGVGTLMPYQDRKAVEGRA